MGREGPSALGGRRVGNPSAYCIGQAGRVAGTIRPGTRRLPATARSFHVVCGSCLRPAAIGKGANSFKSGHGTTP
ncbi:hypothetical protein G6F61_015198 [Rhizopus arrhizus]|nr:hypothetical protein G6F40_017965 [Rhizopus arrhizus]KAG1322293.1 hypothetical protein G6F61_015198 [Rhizopus arrhizus]